MSTDQFKVKEVENFVWNPGGKIIYTIKAEDLLDRLLKHFYEGDYLTSPSLVWSYRDDTPFDSVDPELNKELLSWTKRRNTST